MNKDNFREFYERIGYKVIESESAYWFDLKGVHSFRAIPPSIKINPSADEIKELFRRHYILALYYSTEEATRGRAAALYVCRDKSYGLQSLSKKTRANVKKALKNCLATQLDFDYLKEHGMPLNLDTLQRQHRNDPMFSQPDGWKRFCDAGKAVEGAYAWGALVNDQLAAYLVTFIVDDYCEILYGNSRIELMRFRPNQAVLYNMMTTVLSWPEINCISGGPQSILDLPSLKSYKMQMGFELQKVNFVMILNPLLRPLLVGRLGEKVLRIFLRARPHSDTLKKAVGLLDIAKQSQGS